MAYDVLVLSADLSAPARHVVEFFQAEVVTSPDQLPQRMTQKRYRVLVLDQVAAPQLDLRECEMLVQQDYVKGTPVVVLTSSPAVKEKIKALEIGCDDLIDSRTAPDELSARITKSIFHQIANSQLSQRLNQATETARSAMVDNSDLEANIQFLLQVHNCDNLDQLGQQFFATIQRYGLSCSLQMRSEMGKKDMEAHGMAKHLESQLLFQLKNNGRYVDFGRRTIVNFDRVSLLIKNMPLDDLEKYGTVKENAFCLVQGVNTRILALEDRYRLLMEKEVRQKLSNDLPLVINALKHSYQDVIKQVSGEVEGAVEQIEHRLPHLALTEVDEQLVYQITARLVAETNRVLNDGLKIDELCERLEGAVKRSLLPIENKSAPPGNVVELF